MAAPSAGSWMPQVNMAYGVVCALEDWAHSNWLNAGSNARNNVLLLAIMPYGWPLEGAIAGVDCIDSRACQSGHYPNTPIA